MWRCVIVKEFYPMTIAGLERRLPLCPISDGLYILSLIHI